MRRMLVLLAIAPFAFGAAAQPEKGKLAENVVSRADATQTYTLYLPTSYDAAKKAPLLLVFDPRGRGTVAAEIFREAAEEFGWILISSNQTRSDVADDPNERAVNALLPEAGLYASDPRRLYAAGFSGTAILATLVGIGTGRLAGVIGVGGRLVRTAPPASFSFAHYGFAGDRDFNNLEMRTIDGILEREGKHPHRFQTFPGEHRWITPELAREALGWMEVVAKNEGVTPKVFARDVAGADALLGLEALRRYRAILRTYDGRVPLVAVRARVAALEADPAVRAELEDEKRWDEFERRYLKDVMGSIPSIFAAFRAKRSATSPAEIERALRVSELKRRASRSGAEGATAKRLLESLYAQLSFSMTGPLFERGEYGLAAALLGTAATIHPDRWSAWYNLAAAHAQAGSPQHAYLALEKAIAAGFDDATALESDQDFASLRTEKKFRELVEGLRH
jgi:tetratricopeptide (TPR) repeat protein